MNQIWEARERTILTLIVESDEQGQVVQNVDELTARTGFDRNAVARVMRLFIEDGYVNGTDASTFDGHEDWLLLRPTSRGIQEVRRWRLERPTSYNDPNVQYDSPDVPYNSSSTQSDAPVETTPPPSAAPAEPVLDALHSAREQIDAAEEVLKSVAEHASATEDIRARAGPGATGSIFDDLAPASPSPRTVVSAEDAQFLSASSALIAVGDPKAFLIVVQDVIKRMRTLEDKSGDATVRYYAGAAAGLLQVIAATEDGYPSVNPQPAVDGFTELLAKLAKLGLHATNPQVAFVIEGGQLIINWWKQHRGA